MADFDPQPKTLQTLYAWYNDGKLSVNRRYQRKLVWTLEEKQKLIESILLKYPIPAILLAESDEGYEIIDGLQRLHTLMSFIETGFETTDGRVFDVDRFSTAKSRTEEGHFMLSKGTEGTLTSVEVNNFLDYSTAITVMRGATDDEIDDVFGRINTYGHRLSDQERRQAGVRDDFSEMIRKLACDLRGDATSDTLDLSDLPSISIDLPMSNHGYDINAADTFWVKQGILRSTDLRDSMDEQCLADIAASIIGGQLLERSKSALDAVYTKSSTENNRISAALDSYGSDRFTSEYKYCVDELQKICDCGHPQKLRKLLFTERNTNPFQNIFAALMIALHESLINDNKTISDYASCKRALSGVAERLETRKGSPQERRKNVDTIKGLLQGMMIPAVGRQIYGSHATQDIDAILRRSSVEVAHYELKQGILRLDSDRTVDESVVERIIHTLCAIANNGNDRSGVLIIGVSDKDADANRAKVLDGIEPRKVGTKYVVGIDREARILGESPEGYLGRWKKSIRASDLSSPLKEDILSNIDYNSYFGLGVIVISIPVQNQISWVGDRTFWRSADDTLEVEDQKLVVQIASRFN